MSEKLTGVIHRISETQQVSDKFQKREFILKTQDNPQYEQYIKLELTQDKCSLLDGYSEGQEVEVNYNLRGREWTNQKGEVNYFNTVRAWKIQPVGMEGQQQHTHQPSAPQNNVSQFAQDDQDDLPF